MNMTYARSKFRLTPKEKRKVERDWQQDQSQLYSRKMVTAKSASTLPPAKAPPGRRAARHRLNPTRRSRKDRRDARPAEALAKINAILAELRATA